MWDIVDEAQRSIRPQTRGAQWVPAAWARLRRCPSSAMARIACVEAPWIRAQGARNAARKTSTTGC